MEDVSEHIGKIIREIHFDPGSLNKRLRVTDKGTNFKTRAHRVFVCSLLINTTARGI